MSERIGNGDSGNGERRAGRTAMHALVLCAILSGTAFAQVPLATLTTVDRSTPNMEWLGTAADGRLKFRPLEAKADDKSAEIDVSLDELVAWGTPAETIGGAYVVTGDGGLLAVADPAISPADPDSLVCGTRLFGPRTLSIGRVRGIVFRAPSAAARRDRLFAGVARPAPGERDRLLLTGGDELLGTLKALDGQHVVLETQLGPADKPTAEAATLTFNPALVEKVALPARHVLVGLRDGSLLICSSITGADQTVRLRPIVSDGKSAEWEVARSAVVSLQAVGGRARYLSDLEPTGYRHVPFLSIERPYRLDGNLEGGRLRVGRQIYLKGVAMPSTSRLTFPLDGGAKRFQAEASVDDSAGGRGSVTFRVFVDAEERYRSPIVRGGDAPIAVNVGVTGGKLLSLVIDFAEYGDEQDHADWLNARLVP